MYSTLTTKCRCHLHISALSNLAKLKGIWHKGGAAATRYIQRALTRVWHLEFCIMHPCKKIFCLGLIFHLTLSSISLCGLVYSLKFACLLFTLQSPLQCALFAMFVHSPPKCRFTLSKVALLWDLNIFWNVFYSDKNMILILPGFFPPCMATFLSCKSSSAGSLL